MNTYHILFRNKLRVDKTVELTISAESRSAALDRAETLLIRLGKKLRHYQRPLISQRA